MSHIKNVFNTWLLPSVAFTWSIFKLSSSFSPYTLQYMTPTQNFMLSSNFALVFQNFQARKSTVCFSMLACTFFFALGPKVKHGQRYSKDDTEWQLTTQGPTFCRNTPSLIATPPWKGPTFKGNLKQALRAFFSLENLENSWFVQLEMRFPGARPNAHRPTSLKPAEYSFSYTKG